MAWTISASKTKVNLPSGYWLKEDSTFVFLCLGQEQVARFSAAGIKPEEIERAAKEHHQESQRRWSDKWSK